AALAAARSGARTLLVEKFGALGGLATTGLMTIFSIKTAAGTDEPIVAGILQELVERGVEGGWAKDHKSVAVFHAEGLKRDLDALMRAASVDLLFHSFAADVVTDGARVDAVVVATKQGPWAFRGRVFVDCTGDGDIAAWAGAPFELGRPLDGLTQPVSLMFMMCDVDMERINEYRRSGDWELRKLVADAVAAGEMEPFESKLMGFLQDPAIPHVMYVNFTAVRGVDATNPRDMTRAEIEGRRQAKQLADVFRKRLPGCENAKLVLTAATVGVRESRRIIGDYVLDVHDVLGCRRFEDGIARNSFFVDIHHPEHGGLWNPRYLPRGGWHHIPYRCLLPRGLDNVLTAGRCVSATHEALGSIRVMAQCCAMGQAAGTAAAMAAAADGRPRNVDVRALQQRLREQGAII
ncbi:MAG: FAD-dependent oxidoreductase, partial [Armatimonadetes bacterium]|nr:FAD-dependent oxidoreductase [Armatimonadota bacterium]